MPHVSGEYRVDGLAVPESLEVLHALLHNVAEDHPELDPVDVMLFETAVIEIAGNVVEHGRPAGAVAWTFLMDVGNDNLSALLSDNGAAYTGSVDESTMPESLTEGGRGLALADTILDEFSYARIDQTNTWTMVRRRQ